ncbi:MAG: PAS domain-containing sensor histidine kinase [Haloarculaceae archaeon]
MTPDFVDEVTNYAIFAMDTDGTVTTWNAGAEQIKGYSEEEILGTHYRTFFPEEAIDQGTPERLLVRAETEGSVTGRGWRIHKDGSRFWADFTLTAVHESDGSLRGFTKVLQDLTAEREYQKLLERQNEQLEDFSGKVSHDLTNPLTVARGRLELARETSDDPDLERAAAAVDRSLEIVDELRSQSREGVDAGAVEEVSLAETAKWCWRGIETANETLVVETDQRVRAVPSRLKQILDNLLSNAVEHGGNGVTVTVGDLADGFYVSDNGSGIPEADRERVFERGYTTSGTGLGLHIVRENVEVHGWTVEATDSEERGAEFRIHGVEST